MDNDANQWVSDRGYKSIIVDKTLSDEVWGLKAAAGVEFLTCSPLTKAYRVELEYGITDEIFGVSAGYPGKISAFYSYGAMSVAVPGWVFGTIVGAVCGNILPAFVVSALSIAIYGMFLAVIIPPAKSDRAVMMVVIGAMAVSTAFSVIPILKGISSGFVIIIVTVLVSASAAYFAPIKEEGACDET